MSTFERSPAGRLFQGLFCRVGRALAQNKALYGRTTAKNPFFCTKNCSFHSDFCSFYSNFCSFWLPFARFCSRFARFCSDFCSFYSDFYSFWSDFARFCSPFARKQGQNSRKQPVFARKQFENTRFPLESRRIHLETFFIWSLRGGKPQIDSVPLVVSTKDAILFLITPVNARCEFLKYPAKLQNLPLAQA